MSDHSIVLAVASYRSKAAAERDFDTVRSVKKVGRLDFAAAVLEKGADGMITLDRLHHTTGIASGDALIGAALNVIAAPVGILLLAPAIATPAASVGVAVLVAHFWHNIPRDELFRMSNLLEAGQAALVIVAVDHTTQDVSSLLSNAATTLVTAPTVADLAADISSAVDEPNPAG